MTAFWVIHGNCLLYFIMVGIEISPRYLFFLNKSKFGWLWIITLDLLPLLPRWFFLSILRTGVVVPNQHVSSVFQPLSDRESRLHKEQLFHHRWATILQIVITLCYQSKVNEPNALLIHNAYVKVWFQMEVGRQCSLYAYRYNASCSIKETQQKPGSCNHTANCIESQIKNLVTWQMIAIQIIRFCQPLI